MTNEIDVQALENHIAEAKPVIKYDEAAVEALANQIVELTRAERITKTVLGGLSRSLLEYYQESGNIDLINALLGLADDDKFVLTPMNWRTAVQYFRAFIPHGSNWQDLKKAIVEGGKREPFVFGKKSGNRRKKIGDALAEWLAVDTNDIWVFSDRVKVDAKPMDYAKRITQAITAAIDEDKGGMSPADVFATIFDVDGINADDLMKAMEAARMPKAA